MSKLRTAANAARQLIPASSVPAVARARTRRALADPATMAEAREQMRFLLEVARPEADVEEAARRYVQWMTWRAEARWHPEIVFRQRRIENLHHLSERRTGAVLSCVHHTQYDGTAASFNRAGVRLHGMAKAASLRPDAPPFVRRVIKLVGEHSELFSTEEGIPGIASRVADGHVVAVACDIKGSTPVDFVGRRLVGSSGAARVAFRTGCPVVLVTGHPEDGDDPFASYLRLHPPLWPQDFQTPEALLQEMLRILEESVLAWPEAYEKPLVYWGAREGVPA